MKKLSWDMVHESDLERRYYLSQILFVANTICQMKKLSWDMVHESDLELRTKGLRLNNRYK